MRRPNRIQTGLAVVCAVLGGALAGGVEPQAPQPGEAQATAPQTGAEWEAQADSLQKAARDWLDQIRWLDKASAKTHEREGPLRRQAADERAAGRAEQAKATDALADRCKEEREAYAESAKLSLEDAEVKWKQGIDALDRAAETFAKEGKAGDAARCLVRAADAALGVLPEPVRFWDSMEELRPPRPDRAAKATEARELAERLEGGARRRRKAADGLEATGQPDEAAQQRSQAREQELRAANQYDRAATHEENRERARQDRQKAAEARQRATTGAAPAKRDRSLRDVEPKHLMTWSGAHLAGDAMKLGDLLAPDFNFVPLPIPESKLQKMAVEGVVDQLHPTRTLAERGPRVWSPRRLGVRALFAGPAYTAGSHDREPEATAPGFKLYFSSLGRSTGEAFDVHVVGTGPLPERMSFNGLVVEPLPKSARGAVERQVRKLRGGKRAVARLTGYCLEFLRLPPEAGMVFQVAGMSAQAAFDPQRRILSASRRLHEAGALSPDSDPESYYHSIRQWALWTREQGFDERGYADAFVKHTRSNLEATGRKWTPDMETALRRLAPGRWRDIRRILAEAATE